MSGQAALDMGLVNRAVEQNQTGDAAYGEALSLAREILPQVRSNRPCSSPLSPVCLSVQDTHGHVSNEPLRHVNLEVPAAFSPPGFPNSETTTVLYCTVDGQH